LTIAVRESPDRDPQLNLALLKQAHRFADTEELFSALAQWAKMRRRAIIGGDPSVWSAVLSPDGLRVVTASDDDTARLWDAVTGDSGRVLSAVLSPDGLRVVTASDDKTARLWEVATGKPLATLAGHSGPVQSAVFSPDGLRVVTASDDKTARLWNAVTGKPLA